LLTPPSAFRTVKEPNSTWPSPSCL